MHFENPGFSLTGSVNRSNVAWWALRHWTCTCIDKSRSQFWPSRCVGVSFRRGVAFATERLRGRHRYFLDQGGVPMKKAVLTLALLPALSALLSFAQPPQGAQAGRGTQPPLV